MEIGIARTYEEALKAFLGVGAAPSVIWLGEQPTATAMLMARRYRSDVLDSCGSIAHFTKRGVSLYAYAARVE